MIAFTHLAVGAASGLAVSNTFSKSGFIKKISAIFIVGLASHVVLDSFPHSEYPLDGYVLGLVLAFETLLLMVLVLVPPWLRRVNTIMFVAMLGAAFPDLCSLMYAHLVPSDIINKMDWALHSFHAKRTHGFKVNLLFQVLIGLGAILYVKFKTAK